MTTPRTIDNLGIESSIRWAKDQGLQEVAPVKEGAAVTRLTEIDISHPSYPSKFDLLFGEIERQSTWATFSPPLGFNEQKKRLFTYQVVPMLGSEERLELQLTRVRAQSREKGELKDKSSDTSLSWETQKESEDKEKEKNIILTLMDQLQSLNRFLMDINSRRIQYLKE